MSFDEKLSTLSKFIDGCSDKQLKKSLTLVVDTFPVVSKLKEAYQLSLVNAKDDFNFFCAVCLLKLCPENQLVNGSLTIGYVVNSFTSLLNKLRYFTALPMILCEGNYQDDDKYINEYVRIHEKYRLTFENSTCSLSVAFLLLKIKQIKKVSYDCIEHIPHEKLKIVFSIFRIETYHNKSSAA